MDILNKRSTSLHLAVLFAMLGVLLVLGCSRESTQLRVGINAWPGYEFLYLAQEKGYYKDAGLDVRLIDFNSLPDARRAYERGQIDVIATTVVEVLQIRDHTPRSPQIVQVIDYSNGADVILAQSGIKKMADLKGKRIGVELASLGGYIVARGLAKSGLALSDVKLVSMDQMSMGQDFREGELDAVVTYPPASIKLLLDNKANQIFSTAAISGEVVDVIAIEQEINVRRPKDVSGFLRAFHRAIEYGKSNPTDANRIMAAREGITSAEFAASLEDGMHIVLPKDQADYFQSGGKLAAVVDGTDRVLRETNQIKGPDRRANVINASFVGDGK